MDNMQDTQESFNLNYGEYIMSEEVIEKKEETKDKAEKGEVDTSKMPEGLRKHFEKKGKK